MSGEDIVMTMGMDSSSFDESAESSTSGMLAMGAAVVGAGLAIKGLVDTASEWVGMARTQEVAERQLERMLKQTNSAMGIDRIKAFASARQGLTNFGDEATLQAARVLAPLKITEDQFESLVAGSQDLSVALGKSLPSAMLDMNRAITNKAITGPLARMISKLEGAELAAFKMGTESERAAKLIDMLAKSIGGMARDAVDPMDQFADAWGDVKETTGAMIKGDHDQFYRDMTAAVNNLGRAMVFIGDPQSGAASGFGRAMSIAFAPIKSAHANVMNLLKALGASSLDEALSKLASSAGGVARGALGVMTLGASEAVLQGAEHALAPFSSGAFPQTVTQLGDIGPSGPAFGPARPPAVQFGPGLPPGYTPPRRGRRTGGAAAAAPDTFLGFGPSVVTDNRGAPGEQFGFGLEGGGLFDSLLGLDRDVIGTGLAAGVEDAAAATELANQALRDGADEWGTWGNAARSATMMVGNAMFDVLTGQREMGLGLVAELTKALGQQLWTLGMEQAWRGGFELLTPATAPIGGLRLGMGLTAMAAGVGLGAVGVAMAPPSVSTGGGIGAGGGGGNLGGASGGGGGDLHVTYNYGAVGPGMRESARQLKLVFAEAKRSGIVIA